MFHSCISILQCLSATTVTPVMKRDKFYSLAKGIVILGGVICFALALVNLPQASISWGFLLVLVFSTVVTPRMSLALPHARFAISFSDAFVFLAFLLYGGPAAILVAIFESIANCLFLILVQVNIVHKNSHILPNFCAKPKQYTGAY